MIVTTKNKKKKKMYKKYTKTRLVWEYNKLSTMVIRPFWLHMFSCCTHNWCFIDEIVSPIYQFLLPPPSVSYASVYVFFYIFLSWFYNARSFPMCVCVCVFIAVLGVVNFYCIVIHCNFIEINEKCIHYFIFFSFVCFSHIRALHTLIVGFILYIYFFIFGRFPALRLPLFSCFI